MPLRNRPAAGSPAGGVRVVIETEAGALRSVREAVAPFGVHVLRSVGELIDAIVPYSALERVAALPTVRYVREPARPVADSPVLVGNLAEPRLRAWQWTGLRGAGVKVAVIDLGFVNLLELKQQGYLPADVATVNYCAAGIVGSNTFHGSAVASILHAAAPDAELTLICVDSEVGLAQAEQYAEDNGIQIVNHSVSWLNTGRGDGSGGAGTPDAIVSKAADAGILWINSAGNFGRAHWGGAFEDSDGDGWHEYFDSIYPRWGNRVYANSYGDDVCLALKWDEWPAAQTDLDLYVVKEDSGRLVGASENEQSGTQPPTEEVCFETVPYAAYFVLIHRYAGTASPRIDLYSDRGLELNIPESSIGDPASSPDAFAITTSCGTYPHDTIWPGQGPTIDGRVKPDLGAPDHVTAPGYGIGGSICSDLGFVGSSAAAPHVAGAAALVLEQFPTLSAAQVRSYLEENAFVPAAFSPSNNRIGHGLLRLPHRSPTVQTSQGMTAGAGALNTVLGAFVERATSLRIGSLGVALPSQGNLDMVDFVVPDDAVSAPITVTTPEGTAVSPEPFLVGARVDSVEPYFGCEGTPVTLKGGGFLNATALKIGTTPVADFEVVSATELRFVVPRVELGGTVVVTTTGGIEGGNRPFQVSPPGAPNVTAFAPVKAAVGSTVTVTGTKLKCVIQVVVGNMEIPNYTVAADGRTLRFVVPPGAASGPIYIANLSATVRTKKLLTVLPPPPPPSIKSFSPTHGKVGAKVKISGKSLGGATSVKFNGTSASFAQSGDTITAIVPAGATTGPVSVTTPSSTATTAKSFVVNP
jgi:hypothetical protein